MAQAAVYQPGICNIGPAEVRRRRQSGYVGLAVALIYLILAFALGWAAPWRLLVFFPVVVSASGFLQAAFHFCVNFGTRGLFNFGELGAEEEIHEAEYRRKDQRKALQILLLAVLIGAAVAIIAFLLP